jgi:hypothetical protein
MSLTVSGKYLAKSLQEGAIFDGGTLTHRSGGNLSLPNGKLVACDPLVFPEAEPFDLPLPQGTFPVTLSIALFNSDQRVAFATIRFRDTVPVAWDLLTTDTQASSTLKQGQIFGYGVDAGTGSFMDVKTGRSLQRAMRDNPDFYESIIAELEKTYIHTWSWMNMNLSDDSNLVAFTSGYGDGVYASYAGFDADGEIPVVLTDFRVFAE